MPKDFAELDRRVIVRVSTDIAVAADPRGTRAESVVRQLNSELEAYWRGLKDGQEGEARRRFEAAARRAKDLGLTYRPAGDVLERGDADDILSRLELLLRRGTIDDEEEVAAVLGGEDRPRVMVTGLIEKFEAIESIGLAKMNDKQRRKAHGTRQRAVDNFLIAIGGDKALVDLNRDDGLKFRIALQKRVMSGAIEINSANREMGAVSRMLKTVDLHEQMNLQPIFANLRIAGEEERSRLPFSADWIVRKILAPGALDGLNGEARDIVLLMIDHGFRPSEIADIPPADNKVDAKVPHVSIQPVDKILKSKESLRDIPLVGAGPEIMRRRRNGFPRYRGKDAFSATVNEYFRDNGLMETPEHTIYGLRHSFEDRLTAEEAPDRVIAMLMGHKWHRPKYGAGASLEQRARWLKKISLTGRKHDRDPG